MYKKDGPQEEVQIHKIRITLTSRNVKSLEKGKVLNPSSNLKWSVYSSLHPLSLSLSPLPPTL